MTGNSKRSIRLMSWRTLRWAITLPALPLVWWACTSHPLAQPTPSPEQQTDIYITVAPIRMLDLVVMVDNSPSMAPKVAKMQAQFPNLINALKDPNDGTLPDLRIAIIDSDLGTGGAYPSGSCGPKNGSNYGDLGRFQMIKASDCGVTSSDAIFLEYKNGAPLNYKGDIATVFGCLATNLGTLGCGEEHQLQAFEFALAAKGIGNEGQQDAFLRANAYLGLVFLTDEDDCSAATNDGMFGTKPGDADLGGESASLRCYTRSHACDGKNLSDSGPGYPTTQAFSTGLTNCTARGDDDACPNQTDGNNSTDTRNPTSCSPLKSVKKIADHLKAKKSASDQILVAGIYGWPRKDEDPNKWHPYKIDQVPNPTVGDTAHPTVFDSWPICYDPKHEPSGNGFDTVAAGWGATAGLRNAAFIKEFGENGLQFSICEDNFSEAMKVVGDAIARKLQNLCVEYKLYDSDINTPGLQPSCRVVYRTPEADPNDPAKIVYKEDSNSMPQCPAGATNGNVDADCWQLTTDDKKCPTNGQLIQVLRTKDEIAAGPLKPGTKVGMQCRTCTDFKCTDDMKETEACKACSY